MVTFLESPIAVHGAQPLPAHWMVVGSSASGNPTLHTEPRNHVTHRIVEPFGARSRTRISVRSGIAGVERAKRATSCRYVYLKQALRNPGLTLFCVLITQVSGSLWDAGGGIAMDAYRECTSFSSADRRA